MGPITTQQVSIPADVSNQTDCLSNVRARTHTHTHAHTQSHRIDNKYISNKAYCTNTLNADFILRSFIAVSYS